MPDHHRGERAQTMPLTNVNRVDANGRLPETREELLAELQEVFSAVAERAKAEAAIRNAVRVSKRRLAEAIELRDAYLHFRVETGSSIAAAARAVGVSRQMANRILGGADKETVEGLRHALTHTRGAALASYINALDPEIRADLLAAAKERERG